MEGFVGGGGPGGIVEGEAVAFELGRESHVVVFLTEVF